MACNTKAKQKEYDERRAGTRTRNWTGVFYPEDLPDDWKEQIDGMHIKWIESPVHDKDFNADGSPKKVHIHTLFMFESVKNQKQVYDIFGDAFGRSDNGTVCGMALPQPATDRTALVRYMAHLDNPSKAQYDVNDIIGHNGADPAEIIRYSATETREMIVAMEEYIQSNDIRELCDFSFAIRYDHPEWHTILTTKLTTYFTSFIRSYRNKMMNLELARRNADNPSKKL